jgi:hypothetical protein
MFCLHRCHISPGFIRKVIDFELELQDKHNQGSFQQSLVEIGSVVSDEKIFFKFHPPFFKFA